MCNCTHTEEEMIRAGRYNPDHHPAKSTTNWMAFGGQVEDLKTGDVFSTPSKFPKDSPIFPDWLFPPVSHVGIIVIEDDGRAMVVHNPFGGKPEYVPFEKVFDKRNIDRIIRTGVTKDVIMERFHHCEDEFKCNTRPYEFLNFNCEDFVRSICQCDIGFDQRKGWAIGIAVGLIIIIILIGKKSV